jgi:hypothetical protein
MTCVICKREIWVGRRLIDCDHKFCHDCYDSWITKSKCKCRWCTNAYTKKPVISQRNPTADDRHMNRSEKVSILPTKSHLPCCPVCKVPVNFNQVILHSRSNEIYNSVVSDLLKIIESEAKLDEKSTDVSDCFAYASNLMRTWKLDQENDGLRKLIIEVYSDYHLIASEYDGAKHELDKLRETINSTSRTSSEIIWKD